MLRPHRRHLHHPLSPSNLNLRLHLRLRLPSLVHQRLLRQNPHPPLHPRQHQHQHQHQHQRLLPQAAVEIQTILTVVLTAEMVHSTEPVLAHVELRTTTPSSLSPSAIFCSIVIPVTTVSTPTRTLCAAKSLMSTSTARIPKSPSLIAVLAVRSLTSTSARQPLTFWQIHQSAVFTMLTGHGRNCVPMRAHLSFVFTALYQQVSYVPLSFLISSLFH